MGYAGVEATAGQLQDVDPGALAAVLDETGVVLSSAHVVLDPTGRLSGSQLDSLQTAGVDTAIVAFGPPERFADAGALAALADELNLAADVGRARGMAFGYHNHFWELQSLVEGRPALLYLYDRLQPDVLAEVDIYWAQVGGADPAEVVTALGHRVRFLHVKDGPATTPSEPMVAVGSGAVDVPSALGAGDAVAWHVVELDHCATDMYEAVGDSQRYLARLGLTSMRDPVE
jgi:sugar phosphate isomerase/epimerase